MNYQQILQTESQLHCKLPEEGDLSNDRISLRENRHQEHGKEKMHKRRQTVLFTI